MRVITKEDADRWIGKIKEWEKRFEEVRQSIKPPFSKPEARELLRALKEDLKGEAKWAYKREKENLSPVEEFYCSRIQKVAADFNLRIDSDPCSGKWESKLSYSEVDFTEFRCRVKAWYESSKKIEGAVGR